MHMHPGCGCTCRYFAAPVRPVTRPLGDAGALIQRQLAHVWRTRCTSEGFEAVPTLLGWWTLAPGHTCRAGRCRPREGQNLESLGRISHQVRSPGLGQPQTQVFFCFGLGFSLQSSN